MAYLFPLLATIAMVVALAVRREGVRKSAVFILCGLSIAYLLLEPGAVLRSIAASSVGDFAKGISVAGLAIDHIHLWTVAMVVALTILASIKFKK